MLIRLLLIIGLFAFLAWAALWFLRRKLLRWLKNITPASPAQTIKGEKLVKCDYCHTFIPENRAIIVREHFYCCQEHAPL